MFGGKTSGIQRNFPILNSEVVRFFPKAFTRMDKTQRKCKLLE